MKGRLYVVATPIGNLKDLTLRAIEILQESDLIIAENRDRAMKLLAHLGLKKPVVTINTYSEEKKARGIVARMEKGELCALISAAGTPCISDPGKTIVQRAYEAGIEVLAAPGPSSVIAALCISGVPSDKFLFYGFLPLKTGKRRTVLRTLGGTPYPVVFLESPRRMENLLQVIRDEWGNRFVVIAKEMTKLYEEVIRGPVEDLIEGFASEVKGEYTVVVAPEGFEG
ncbi:MAG TPA: 16S rRNA (cytidine(1402)-2'-O)-methyltransferase [Deltaproteobacteria bacterium]|nr:16S rRNA (cytidine(1402)-2'-O)-methyltransferase [Deltaproteobacteria bacterium]